MDTELADSTACMVKSYLYLEPRRITEGSMHVLFDSRLQFRWYAGSHHDSCSLTFNFR